MQEFCYNNLQTTQPNQAKMNIFSTQNCFNSYSLLYPQFTAYFYSPQNSSGPEASSIAKGLPEKNTLWQYKLVEQVESPSFQTRFEPSIIIRSNTELSHPETTKTTILKRSKQTKPIQKKITQKESRNVASNLLRIFLKHVLELKFYDHLIQKMIDARSLSCTVESFRCWLTGFNINYKNYIRFTEIKRVIGETQNSQMKAIFRMLLRKYIQGVGAQHCLTSRRIDRSALSMHLSGLRELLEQVSAK